MQNLLDFSQDNSKTGFRLEHFEVLNWGTFHNRIWKLEPHGDNSLLTGDIGSGKSTLVDALSTLLVPHHKIAYNKAAGAENRERTRYSYIRGEYKNIRDEATNILKPVFLRDDNLHAVLLARFYNQGYAHGVSIAQVFWLKNNRDEKFFVISENDLSISNNFTGFGTEISALRKRLRGIPKTEVFDSFSDYGSRLRTLFGIKSEKAMDLFNQTVSMKSVGNLTGFVRNHMLEKTDIKDRLDELRRNFENLTKAHEAIQKARRQLELLEPLVSDSMKFRTLSFEIEELKMCLEALPIYFFIEKSRLLKDEIERLVAEHERIRNKISEMERQLEGLRDSENEIRTAIAGDEAGRRIEEIEKRLSDKEESRKEKSRKAEEYKGLTGFLNLPSVLEEESFYQTLSLAKVMRDNIEGESERLRGKRDDLVIGLRILTDELNRNISELGSLRQRKTQIPESNLKIRGMIARDLDLDESELPFAGELIKVREDARAWEGVIEKVLHNFGLSVLVPEQEYRRVSNYVNRTNLRDRLVYFKVSEISGHPPRNTVHPASLLKKIEIKGDSQFYNWLEKEISERFNLACCDDIEQFQRESFAITREGQVKTGKIRHEKDDRREINDRRHFILGWSNREKIKAIEREIAELEKKKLNLEKEIKASEIERKNLEEKNLKLHDLLKFKDFSEIDWPKEAMEIQVLKDEKEALERSSDSLRSLKDQLRETRKEIEEKEKEKDDLNAKRGKIENEKSNRERELAEGASYSGRLTKGEQDAFFPRIAAYVADTNFTLRNIDRYMTETRNRIESLKNGKGDENAKLRDGIISRMQRYKGEYPAETSETDASVEAIPEFERYLKKIHDDDLPAYEARFKELLNRHTIHDIVLLKNQLEQSEKDIKDKIKEINRSLREIEYNPGSYLELLTEKVHDQEISEFLLELRGCMENTLGEAELYNEDRFLRVKKILDRFNSGSAVDMNWTAKVTDVRQWFEFAASEKWLVDGKEKEHYNDSSGKSGGQKEKLAYTILAAALAYQFGLEWSRTRSRSFRFVVIDEAFGRGSDESTRYALELFRKLNLQLLIVTPLQKINIIEDYINAVHFVSNKDGGCSEVLNLTKQQYLENKERYLSK
jgi:uncharacterized protein YPO0396